MAAVDQLFLWVLATSWSASLLILFVWGAVRLLGRRLSAGWRYGLWLLIVARLVLPSVPEFRWGLANPVDQFARTGKLEPTRSSEFGAIDVNKPRPAPFDLAAIQPGTLLFPDPRTEPAAMPDSAEGSWIAAEWLLRVTSIIWLVVAAALAVRMIWQTWRFLRFVRELPVTTEGPVAAIFEEATRTLGAYCRVTLVVDPRVGIPMLVGLFRPRLLLPTDLVDQLTTDELRMVLLHELAHAKRRDVLIQAACQLLRIVHWFNPIVRFGLARVETACESACDATVLNVLGRERSLDYGRTLLNVLDAIENRMTSSASASVAGTVGIMSRTSAIEERISMIVHGRKMTRGAHGLGLLTALIVALLGLTVTRNGFAADGQPTEADQLPKARAPAEAWDASKAPPVVIETYILRVNKPLEGLQWQTTQSRITGPNLDERVLITRPKPRNWATSEMLGHWQEDLDRLQEIWHIWSLWDRFHAVHKAFPVSRVERTAESVEKAEIILGTTAGKPATVPTVLLTTCTVTDESRDRLIPRPPAGRRDMNASEPVSTTYGRAATFTLKRVVPFVVATIPIKTAGATSFDPCIQEVPESHRVVVVPHPGKDGGHIRLGYSFNFSQVAWPVRTLQITHTSANGAHMSSIQMPEIRVVDFESEAEIPLGSSLLVGGMTWTDSEGSSHPLYVLISARAVEK